MTWASTVRKRENKLTCWLTFVPTAWPLTAVCATGKKKWRRRDAWRGTQKRKEGDAGARGCAERGAEGTRGRGWREILLEGVQEREMPTAPLSHRWQLPHVGQSPANPTVGSFHLEPFFGFNHHEIATERSRVQMRSSRKFTSAMS